MRDMYVITYNKSVFFKIEKLYIHKYNDGE